MYAESIQTKKNMITNLNKRCSDKIDNMQLEISSMKHATRGLKRKYIANQSLAVDRLENMKKLRALVNKLKLELQNEAAARVEVEECLSHVKRVISTMLRMFIEIMRKREGIKIYK
mmetsp:Transcript_6363/g.12888  ORF Transcript_6363/g.12888 Transcript_6363/m.12888 type:complete len:116 (-) Transcript_6363:31-378(-)